MSTASDPNNILRFVQLRSPDNADAIFRLLDSNISTDLALTDDRSGKRNRDDRRRKAIELLERGGRSSFTEVSGEAFFSPLLEAYESFVEDSKSRSIRAFLEKLVSQEVFLEASQVGGPLGYLSDLILLAIYYPQQTIFPFDDVEIAFRILTLLRIAHEQRITPASLREGDSRNDDFLNLDLEEFFSEPIFLPELLEFDYAEKFSVGIADLLVVKQHIKCYEPSEIAHIENVMASEKRERKHRRLDRSEEIFSVERETEVEKETELETTERFELSEEVSRTVQADQQLSFGVSLSGSYGSINFASDSQFQRSESREQTSNSSTTYAKDVVERSLERVRERVNRKRTTRILQEVEESNLHAFKNDSNYHINGIYQFVDKVYEAQVFNYGQREMFDLMIPEPASYLWHRRNAKDTSDSALPEPIKPDELPEGVIPTLLDRYQELAVKYRADGIEAPPRSITVSSSKRYPDGDATGGDKEQSAIVLDINIPDTHKPVRAWVNAIALDNTAGRDTERNFVGFLILDKMVIQDYQNGSGNVFGGGSFPSRFAEQYENDSINVGAIEGAGSPNVDIALYGTDGNGIALDPNSLPDQSQLKVGVIANNTKNYAVSVRIDCEPTDAAEKQWQLKTFDSLVSAYQERLLEYQEALARYNQEQRQSQDEENLEREFGTPPSLKEEIIRRELKKHSIAIVTEDFFTANNADKDGNPVMISSGATATPPQFDLKPARERGAFTRFFEQAFEWENMQYVFYPYFWASNDTWNSRFDENDPAHRYRQFLQAGWARVVVPVRPNFESALHYYLLTEHVWLGKDLPPRIGDELSISIANEIRNRTDQGVLEAIPEGDSWEVRVPTSLIYLRETSDFPKWEWIEPQPDDTPKNYWDWRVADSSGDSASPLQDYLSEERAISVLEDLYVYLSQKNWEQARTLYRESLEPNFRADFFNQFERVTVENLQITSRTNTSISFLGENTYVYGDETRQREERVYTVRLIDNRPILSTTNFLQVIQEN